MARDRPMLKLLVADIIQSYLVKGNFADNPRLNVARVESVRATALSDLVTLIRVTTPTGVHYYEVKVSEKI
jgi:hypothetical protein